MEFFEITSIAAPDASLDVPNLPFQPGRWGLNLASIPDALPQAKLRWSNAVGVADPLDPRGPCLVQPDRLATGIPMSFYYQGARTGLNAEGASISLDTEPSEDLPVPVDPGTRPCGEPRQPDPNQPDEARLGSYLAVAATIGAGGTGSEGQEWSSTPIGEIDVVADSLRWIVRACNVAGTQFEPGGVQGGVRMSRRMTHCAPAGETRDLSSYLSPEDGSGSVGTSFRQPRLGEIFPVGSGSGWVVSCVRLDVIEHLDQNTTRYHAGLAAHDWFYLADQATPGLSAAALAPINWYDLSGDNGCPIPIPPLQPPPGVPLLCGQSELKVTGAPSTSASADYDGPVETRFKIGDNRQLSFERMDAGRILVQTHDVDPATQTYSWHLDSIDAGVYEIRYTVQTACPWPNIGGSESFDITFHLHKPGNKCSSQGNAVSGMTARFAVGFSSFPTGMVAGSTYNGGLVVLAVPQIGMIAVVVPIASLSSFVQATSDDRNVGYCELDGVAQAAFAPNDERYQNGEQYGLTQVQAPVAWDTTLGTTTKVICIVDSGILYTHEDLAGSRWLGGYDFLNDDADPDDNHGHGTHVAGIAVATINNQLGIAGIAQVGFKAAKVYDSTSLLWDTTTAAGIVWCADNGGDVINVSLAGANRSSHKEAATRYAVVEKKKIVVASAGNDGPCANSDCVAYPGKHAEVIAVAATDSAENQWGQSSEGLEVDLAAPGEGIVSTGGPAPHCPPLANTMYCSISGTSMATPFVAAAAALIWSYEPGLTNQEIRTFLECKAKDKGEVGVDNKYGHGILQIKDSLDAAIAGSCSADSCTGRFTLNGAAPGSTTYSGATLVMFKHGPKAAHPSPGMVTVTASDGAYIHRDPSGHDQWYVYAADHGTRRVTFSVTLPPCSPISVSWMQYN